MKIRRQSAVLVVFLLALFVASAFMLLSIQDGEFNPLAIVAGAVLVFFNVFFYTALRRVFKHLDRFAMLAAQFLWSMGLVILFRIDQNIAIRQFLWLLVGAVALIIAMLFIRRTGDLGKWNWVLMGVTLLLLLSSLVLGRSIGGARNWISLGGVSIQPSEFAKILFIIVSAYFLTTRSQLKAFIPYLIFTAACVLVLVLSKDLGAALLIAGTFLVMFFAATGRVFTTLLGIGILGGGAFLSSKIFSHVRTRVDVWLDPWSQYDSGGYQIVQGLIALASGGLIGVGLGRGTPGVIPAHHTDYIFTVIGQEFGIIVGVLVIAFYLVFIIRGALIAINAKNTFDALLVFGCTAMLSLQSFIIIGGVIKLIPLTGITMPFVSYGGSSMLSSMVMLGIIEGVAEKTGKREERQLTMMGGGIE